MRLSVVAILLALPIPALAAADRQHCNYYHFVTKLPAPLIALESEPVEPNDTEKMVNAVETVCTRTHLINQQHGEVWQTIPGTRQVTWKLSVAEGPEELNAKPPFATITVNPPAQIGPLSP